MSKNYDAIVIGAGITGAATAYQLKKAGVGKVLLLESAQPAAGGTGKSAAIVRQHYSTALMARIALDSVALFETMEEELQKSELFFNTGWMMLIPEDLYAAAAKNLEMQRSIGIDTEFLDQAEWRSGALEWLNPEGIAAVAYERRGGHADPVRVTEAYCDAFQRLGGELRVKTPVRAIQRVRDKVIGVLTDDGELGGDIVVNAAGPWASALAQSAGIEMDMRVVREQDTIWEAVAGRPLPPNPISNASDAIYSVPGGGRRLLIGQGFPKDYLDVDPNNYKETGDDDFVSLILERAQNRFPGLQGMKLLTSYAALYDVTPDWYPFVGFRSGLEGYVDACGGSGHGFKIAPAIALELAHWIVDSHVKDDFAGLSYDRLKSGNLFVGSYGGNRG